MVDMRRKQYQAFRKTKNESRLPQFNVLNAGTANVRENADSSLGNANANVMKDRGSIMHEEAIITINGKQISSAMSMTIRVAIEGFSMELKENGLGPDKHGKEMVALYQERINEIRGLLYKNT